MALCAVRPSIPPVPMTKRTRARTSAPEIIRRIALVFLTLTVFGSTETVPETITEPDVGIRCAGPGGGITVENQTNQTVAFSYSGTCSEDFYDAVLKPYERSRFEGGKEDAWFMIEVKSPHDKIKVYRFYNAGEAVALKWHGTVLAPALLCPGRDGYLKRYVTIENATDQTVHFNLTGNCSGSNQVKLEPLETGSFGEGDAWFDIIINYEGGTARRRLHPGGYFFQWGGGALDIFPES